MVTPLELQKDLARVLDIKTLYFKREDLHPYGSHKGRSIPKMIDIYIADGEKRFCLSSSGNAALAAALYINELNAKNIEKLELDIFVGNNISAHKLEKLKKLATDHVRVLMKERPRQAAMQSSQEGMCNLRQSLDDNALIGYESLAKELAEQKDIGAVFIATSSGTTAQALAHYFVENKIPIQVHIVQTSSCHPMVNSFDLQSIPDEKSIADAIVDPIAFREPFVVPLIKETGGRGWCATNDETRTAQEFTRNHGWTDISVNSALSVAGAMQATYMGYKINGAVVCLICGD
ncbi:MAG: PLP-dependent lyase/thiolase [bacterium]|nr:PLP-dependent lyase/thiolase [bacterium]